MLALYAFGNRSVGCSSTSDIPSKLGDPLSHLIDRRIILAAFETYLHIVLPCRRRWREMQTNVPQFACSEFPQLRIYHIDALCIPSECCEVNIMDTPAGPHIYDQKNCTFDILREQTSDRLKTSRRSSTGGYVLVAQQAHTHQLD